MWVTPIGLTVFKYRFGERTRYSSLGAAYQADQAVRLSSRAYTRLTSFA
jgi:hypothetical protein